MWQIIWQTLESRNLSGTTLRYVALEKLFTCFCVSFERCKSLGTLNQRVPHGWGAYTLTNGCSSPRLNQYYTHWSDGLGKRGGSWDVIWVIRVCRLIPNLHVSVSLVFYIKTIGAFHIQFSPCILGAFSGSNCSAGSKLAVYSIAWNTRRKFKVAYI